MEIHFDTKSGPHMHITDAKVNVYDKNLNNLTAKLGKEHPGLSQKQIEKRVDRLPEAHIEISEFEELRIAIKESPVQFKLHPPDKLTQYHHVHVYDKFGNSLNLSLRKVNKNSPEAHVKIEEFVKIFMEYKL